MFRVNLHLIGIDLQTDIQENLTLKIKKEHWHYSLVEKIQGNILNLTHQIEIRENGQGQPSFELLLVLPQENSKGVVRGSATINIMEWPMQRPKREKVWLSPHAWIDLELSYEYIALPTDSTFSESGFEDIQILQKVTEVEGQNEFLKSKIKELQHQYEQLIKINKKLQQRRETLTHSQQLEEKEDQINRVKLQTEKRDITRKLEQTNLKLTGVVNFVFGNADFATIATVNQVLEHRDNK